MTTNYTNSIRCWPKEAIFCHSCASRNPVFPVKTGTQFLMFLVPCFRRDDVWIPLPTGRQAFSRLRAEALLRAGTGMTTLCEFIIR